jgi:hypothetical protein
MAKNREVVDQFLPALKGDYLAVDKYTYREGKHGAAIVACLSITSFRWDFGQHGTAQYKSASCDEHGTIHIGIGVLSFLAMPCTIHVA